MADSGSLSDTARVLIGTLLYSVRFDVMNDHVLERTVQGLIHRPIAELAAADGQRAVIEALSSSAQLSAVITMPDHADAGPSEQDFRAFLQRVVDRMDELRPWPVPTSRELSSDRWPADYVRSGPIARLALDPVQVQRKVGHVFADVTADSSEIEVLILRFATGHDVAFVSPWWADTDDVAIVPRDPDAPVHELLDAVFGNTGLEVDDLAPPGSW